MFFHFIMPFLCHKKIVIFGHGSTFPLITKFDLDLDQRSDDIYSIIQIHDTHVVTLTQDEIIDKPDSEQLSPKHCATSLCCRTNVLQHHKVCTMYVTHHQKVRTALRTCTN